MSTKVCTSCGHDEHAGPCGAVLMPQNFVGMTCPCPDLDRESKIAEAEEFFASYPDWTWDNWVQGEDPRSACVGHKSGAYVFLSLLNNQWNAVRSNGSILDDEFHSAREAVAALGALPTASEAASRYKTEPEIHAAVMNVPFPGEG